MDTPRIQYAKTSDGVNIAFCVIGEGGPAVCMPWVPYSHLQMEWQAPHIAAWYQRLATGRQLVRYDSRGSGLSDREVGDLSLDAYVLDLEAVINRTGLQRLALLAPIHAGPLAIVYADRHPDRISRLVLWCSYDRFKEISTQVQWLQPLLESDWETYTEAAAQLTHGWRGGQQSGEHAAFARECIDQETLQRASEALAEFDVTAVLPRVAVPTLVLHRRRAPVPNLSAGRRLAFQISHARLTILEGTSADPFMGDIDPAIQAITEFLEEGDAVKYAGSDLPSGMTAILFADIADSTALTERLGDAAFRAKARELGPALRVVVRECGGTPVEGPTLGDGVLAVFTSAREAIAAAVRCAKAGEDAGLPLHLGLHAGDVTREKDPDGRDNVYGGAVNIAARISGLSAAGEVLVSETVRSLARTSAGVRFEDRGEQALKGVGEAVRVWRVVEGEG